jgi:hypothetical protein
MPQNVREYLTTEELLMLSSTKIRGTWQAVLERWFPSMKTLVSPTSYELLVYSFAVVGETAYFATMVNYVVKALSTDVGRGIQLGFGAALFKLFYKYATNPSLAKKLFMDMVGLIVVMVQLALSPYTAGVRYIDDKLITKKIIQASVVVASIAPEYVEPIVKQAVIDSTSNMPEEQQAARLVANLQAAFSEPVVDTPIDLLIQRKVREIAAIEKQKYDERALTL